MWNHLVRYAGRRDALQVRRVQHRLRRHVSTLSASGPELPGVPGLRSGEPGHGGSRATDAVLARSRSGILWHRRAGPARRCWSSTTLNPLRAAAQGLAVPARPAPREAGAGHLRATRRTRAPSGAGDLRRCVRVQRGACDRYDFKLVRQDARCSCRTTPTRSVSGAGQGTKAADILGPSTAMKPALPALGTAPRVGGRSDAQAGQAPHLLEAGVLPRRGQLGRRCLSDEYDARGQPVPRRVCVPTAFAYDAKVQNTSLQATYDLNAGLYASQGNCGLYPPGIVYSDGWPSRDWQPDALAGAGIR